MAANSSKILLDIFESAIEAQGHWDAWWAIAHHARPSYIAQMNRYPAFFALTERAHFNSVIINLAHLFEKRNDVSTIDRYLKGAAALYSDKEIATVRRRLAGHAPTAKGVVAIRNNVVAHKSSSQSGTEVFAAAKLTPRRIAGLIDEATSLVHFFVDREKLSERITVLSGVGEATLAIIGAIPVHGV